jgi:MoaA/NifB/PqqE/SkfB family radical SAM enzyme
MLLLEQFFEKMNYSNEFISYPLVAYHGYYSRRIGCAGGGKDYLYIDTDGDVHNCPFCQRKLFSALSDLVPEKIGQMRRGGCTVFN